ncbi:MAG: phosphotransferase [Pseudomonadales bacterium]|nr:phosphotransferase [Pseudomonadales bacterium]MCP5184391.1 phosphotransferase [Pseudomonadales bacterium]
MNNAKPPIVSEPEDVTADWLTAVLRHAGQDATVSGFTARDVGTGQVGRSVRFSLTYADGSGPASIVGKFASSDPTSRATGIAQRNYFKEVMFYNDVLPTVTIRTPKPLLAAIEPATHAFCLMLEDMTPARQGDQIQGCNVAEARLAVREAAGLHGPRWNDPTLADIEWLQPNAALGPDHFITFWNQLYPGFIDRYHDRLPPEHRRLLERFTGKLDRWTQPPPGPQALTHGDYRLDNMLFGDRCPLAVVDWQTVSIGNPVSDVAYFLGAGLLPENRALHERELVREYHDALQSTGVSDYDFETCFRDYRRYSFSGLIMAVIASMIVVQTPRGDDMFMAMANRHSRQALELDAEALLV